MTIASIARIGRKALTTSSQNFCESVEEYFDVFSVDFAFMAGFWKFWTPYALILSILLSSLEIILAIALALNYRIKQTLYAFLALLAFFGFLTFYSAYFNKVTDCGCFGETIKLTPWTSFGKDIFLIALTVILLIAKKPANKKTGKWVAISAVLSIALGTYCYFHLPINDGLPYAVGNHIPTNMKEREPLKFTYTYKIKGVETELKEMPTDTTAEFISMKAVNEKEAKPLITDYQLWAEGDTTNYTQESFKGAKLMIIIPNIHHMNEGSLPQIEQLTKELKNITVWLVSASADAEVNALRHTYQLAFPALSADTKILKTIVRSSPGLWLLKDGTVKGKWSSYALPSADEIQQSLE